MTRGESWKGTDFEARSWALVRATEHQTNDKRAKAVGALLRLAYNAGRAHGRKSTEARIAETHVPKTNARGHDLGCRCRECDPSW